MDKQDFDEAYSAFRTSYDAWLKDEERADCPKDVRDKLLSFARLYDGDFCPKRYREATKYAFEVADKLEEADLETLAADLALWENVAQIQNCIEKADLREKNAAKGPARSVRELRDLGVSDAQICLIYKFWDEKGNPDYARLQREFDNPGSEWGKEPANDEAAKDASLIASVDYALNEGVPTRVIAVRSGKTVEEIEARAQEIGVVPSVALNDVPPRIKAKIKKVRAENPLADYAEIAREVSTTQRVYTEEEVGFVLNEA